MLQALSTAELAIAPSIADVRLASDWLARNAAACGVPEAEIGRLDMCLNEALANVIAHGGDSAAAQAIRLLLQVTGPQRADRQASLTVSDAGPAFDAATAPLKQHANTLADATPGGLGLLLMRQFSDALSYQRLADRNLLTFRVRW